VDFSSLPTWADTAAHVSAVLVALGLVWAIAKPALRFACASYSELRFMFSQRKLHQQIDDKLDQILSEVKPNHGGSIKDSVIRIEEKMDYFGAARRAERHNSPIATVETDERGGLVWGNKALIELMGTPLESMKGSGWVNTILPEQRQWVEDTWARAVEQRREFSEDITYIRPDGTTFKAHASCQPIMLDDGTLKGYLAEIKPI